MKVVITGNIGSGKSTVIEIFKKLGVPVFDSDEEAKRLYKEPEIKNEIRKLFGDNVFDGQDISRKKLANLIFNDELALKKITSFVHPIIFSRYIQWYNEQDVPYTLKETALLFETNSQLNYDKIITVVAPEEIRIQRVMKRDKVSREEVEERIKNQLPEDVKCSLSDYVIINDGKHSLQEQVEKIHIEFNGLEER